MKRLPVVKATPEQMKWAGEITAAWGKMLTSILETGQKLIDAKDDLGHGSFQKMIKAQLPFSVSTAQCLMAIARNPQLTNAAHARYLPPHWPTLYVLSQLSEPAFKDALETGRIYSDMTRMEANKLVLRDVRVQEWAALPLESIDNPYDADLRSEAELTLRQATNEEIVPGSGVPAGDRATFLKCAEEAKRLAVYSGTATKELIAAARAVAVTWNDLAEGMEETYHALPENFFMKRLKPRRIRTQAKDRGPPKRNEPLPAGNREAAYEK